jgi:hypothetical protein
MTRVTKEKAYKIGKMLGIDFRSYKLALWTKAMNIELEHGKKGGSLTNVTNDNLYLTGMIALAHIREYKNYYEHLIKMEKTLEREKRRFK